MSFNLQKPEDQKKPAEDAPKDPGGSISSDQVAGSAPLKDDKVPAPDDKPVEPGTQQERDRVQKQIDETAQDAKWKADQELAGKDEMTAEQILAEQQRAEEEAAARAAADASAEGDYSPAPLRASAFDEHGNYVADSSQVGGQGASSVPPAQRTYGPTDAELTGFRQVPDERDEEIPVSWDFHDNRFGNDEKLNLVVHKYAMGEAIAICSYNEQGEPFAKYTVNLGAGVPGGHVAVKTWSEGEGAIEVLKGAGVIEGEPVQWVASGHVRVPIYKLTDKFAAFAKKTGSTAEEQNQ